MKRHYIFASHGTFANGLLNSVELILGKQPDIHTLCAYVEEEADLTQQVETLLARFPAQDELTDKYHLFIVVESVNDAWRIASAVEGIKSINLGGIKAKEGSKNISKAINLLPEEIEQLQQLVGKGVEVEIRQVPNDRKQLFAQCV